MTIGLARDQPTPLPYPSHFGSLGAGRHAHRTTGKGLLGQAALSMSLRLVRSTRSGALAVCQKASTAIRTIVTRAEHDFADFAEIPYQDTLKRQELSQLLTEFEQPPAPRESTAAGKV